MNKKNNYFLRSIFRPILNLGYSFDRMYRGYCNWVPSFLSFCNPSKFVFFDIDCHGFYRLYVVKWRIEALTVMAH